MILAIVIALLISLALITLISFFRSNQRPSLPQQLKLRLRSSNSKYLGSKHRFETSSKTGLYYCNICTKMLGGLCQGQGLECKVCGILVHQLCRYKRKPDCKNICLNSGQISSQPTHQWVAGNLAMNSLCSHCELICSSYYTLEGNSCLQCQKVVHDECKEKISRLCVSGSLEKQIISPEEVIYQRKQSTRVGGLGSEEQKIMHNQTYDSSSEPDDVLTQAVPLHQKLILGQKEVTLRFVIHEKKVPIIVLINRNSGGQSGQAFLNSFYRYLNPIQVISIIDDGLERLKLFTKLRDLKILVAGGDGTVGSCINYLRSGELEDWKVNQPPVAILPLGTGNDLSRALGWGGSFESLDAHDILQQVASVNNRILLDRWKVQIRYVKPNNPLANMFKKFDFKVEELTMFNYFGIGLDARFCLGFHNLRQRNPNLFKSRIGNKFIYTHMGLNDLLAGRKFGLGKMITLICDGNKIEVPEKVENLVVLNINSWAGGVSNLWKVPQQNQQHLHHTDDDATANRFKPQRFSDGLLEVIGVSSILHLGRIQVGIDEPYMICQGRDIKLIIESHSSQAIQVDGEPQEIRTPIEISFIHVDKVQMLSKTSTNMVNWEHKLLQTMNQAVENKFVTQEAKEYILNMMLQ